MKFCHVHIETPASDEEEFQIEKYFVWKKTSTPRAHLSVVINPKVRESIRANTQEYILYFIPEPSLPAIEEILRNEGVKPDNCLLYDSYGVGHHDFDHKELENIYSTMGVVNDIHHSINPLSYLVSTIRRRNPNYLLFVSSIVSGDFISAYFGIPYSLATYQLAKLDNIAQIAYIERDIQTPRVNYFGSLVTPFHPRRTDILNGVIDKLAVHPFTDFDNWYLGIPAHELYLHTSLNGNFSHHVSFPMQRGGVLAVDAALASNPYFSGLLADGETCVTYGNCLDLMKKIESLSQRDLARIASCATERAEQYFPTMTVQPKDAIYPFPDQPIINEIAEHQFWHLRSVLVGVDAKEFDFLVNIIEILQEIHRFLVKPVVCIIRECDRLSHPLAILVNRYYYFRVCEESDFKAAGIYISSKLPPSGYQGIWMQIRANSECSSVDQETFRFSDYHEQMLSSCVPLKEYRYWPQLVNPRLKVHYVNREESC